LHGLHPLRIFHQKARNFYLSETIGFCLSQLADL